jgi:hypothetical protein
MHSQAMFVHTWSPRLSQSKHAKGGHNCGNLETVIKRVWRCSWMPCLMEIGGVHGGDRSEGVDRERGVMAAETLFIRSLVIMGW